jgi:hypothetical protein
MALPAATTVSTIPLSNFELPWYDFTMTLDNVRYTLGMRYNSRMDRWFLDIGDAQANPLVVGICLLTGRLLTSQYTSQGLPTGYFFVVDNKSSGKQPGMQSFVTGTHTLYYASII